SLPRWRQFLLGACNTARLLGATLNWRRDPGYELRMLHYEQRRIQFEPRKMQHELRMKQLESDILRVNSDSERIGKETEQLRRENARQRALSALIEQHCFPDESNSIPLPPTEPGSGSS
ncbi:MAG: hypothetical protein ACK52U_04950, partial [Synechococcaceae cyanobacterium]